MDEHFLAFQSGEERGFDYFFRAYYKRLCYYAARFIKDPGIIEEMVNDSFINVWYKRENFTQEASLKNYLYATVRNACYNRLRNKKLIKTTDTDALFGKEIAEGNILESMIHSEFIHQVWQAFKYLPPACRNVLQKLYIEGKSVKETAIELQLALSTVKTQKDRGISKLRKHLFPADT